MNDSSGKGNQNLATHLALLSGSSLRQDEHELHSTPIFTPAVLEHAKHAFDQYGFLAGVSSIMEANTHADEAFEDPRVFFNISAPSSAFICGSQGSGKSHTLSCLLENCLIVSGVSKLESPLVSCASMVSRLFPNIQSGRSCLSLRQLHIRCQRNSL